jgi:hypothetical protein
LVLVGLGLRVLVAEIVGLILVLAMTLLRLVVALAVTSTFLGFLVVRAVAVGAG